MGSVWLGPCGLSTEIKKDPMKWECLMWMSLFTRKRKIRKIKKFLGSTEVNFISRNKDSWFWNVYVWLANCTAVFLSYFLDLLWNTVETPVWPSKCWDQILVLFLKGICPHTNVRKCVEICSNIAPFLSSGNHLFCKAEYMGRSYLNQVWAITIDCSALAT